MASATIREPRTRNMPSENQVIDKVRRRVKRNPGVVVGIGDDAAVLKPTPGHDMLACCDLLIEGVHFRREWCDAKLIGRKALAVNLSDIAAMGGVPRFAMVSVAIGGGTSGEFIDSLLEGLIAFAEQNEVAVVGGDTSSSPGPCFIDVSVIGECLEGRAITRSGAKPGDAIFVTGSLGGSALGLGLLENGVRLTDEISSDLREALIRHLLPEPRLGVGKSLGEGQMATAMIDISDGFSTDLNHLLEESGCGAVIESSAIPISSCFGPLSELEMIAGVPATALNGGEEYELLFTAKPENISTLNEIATKTGVSITRIGEITERRGFILREGATDHVLTPRGYEHFF